MQRKICRDNAIKLYEAKKYESALTHLQAYRQRTRASVERLAHPLEARLEASEELIAAHLVDDEGRARDLIVRVPLSGHPQAMA